MRLDQILSSQRYRFVLSSSVVFSFSDERSVVGDLMLPVLLCLVTDLKIWRGLGVMVSKIVVDYGAVVSGDE